jgi:hypothetical protein
MNFVKSMNIYGTHCKEIPCITGPGAPKTSTVGAVGSLYMNEDNGDIYKCVNVSDGVYTWKPLNKGVDGVILPPNVDREIGDLYYDTYDSGDATHISFYRVDFY